MCNMHRRTFTLLFVAFATILLLAVFPLRAFAATDRIALLADTHLGLPNDITYEETEEALYWASEYDDLRAVCVAGDLTDRGDPEAYSEWEFLCDSILDGTVRTQALGDHDTGKNGLYLEADRLLTVANGLRCFKEINGGAITSYTELRNANIMTVGGVRARGYSVITNSMLKLLNARLKKTARQGKMAIVVCHYPHDSGVLNNRAKLMGILRSYPNVIYVSGHKHQYSSGRQCKKVSPQCTTTPYTRAGFKQSTKYALRAIGVNACSAYRSGNGNSYADMLSISQSGGMTLEKWNLTKGSIDKKWTFNQVKSSITVKFVPSVRRYPAKGKSTFKVTFSDGGTYGGLKSGSKFSLAPGKTRKFKGIPAGVLVTIKQLKAPAGWTKAKTRSVEVTNAARTVTMKAAYRGGEKLRAAQ